MRRASGAALLCAVTAVAVLALLGLTWQVQEVPGALGAAGQPELRPLDGRSVAPVAAALTPGAVAAAVLSLLLRRWPRALALLLAGLATAGCAVAAGAVAGSAGGTWVPWAAAVLAVVATSAAVLGAVAARNEPRPGLRAGKASDTPAERRGGAWDALDGGTDPTEDPGLAGSGTPEERAGGRGDTHGQH